MRNQLVKTVEALMKQDERLAILLGDISAWLFHNVLESYPDRAYNIGICEQAMAGMAAGLAMEGFRPMFYSIAPFAVERCLEQIKIDICYQNLPVTIVSVGASYDYASFGCAHHCPGDVAILRTLPGMEIVVPGTPEELHRLFQATYADGHPTYLRLSEQCNQRTYDVQFGRANVVRQGKLATVIAVGPMLDRVLEATNELDATVLYYTTVAPFDAHALRENCQTGKIIVVEPFYEGTLAHDITAAMESRSISLLSIGVPRRFLRGYGQAADHDLACGLTAEHIRERCKEFIDGQAITRGGWTP